MRRKTDALKISIYQKNITSSTFLHVFKIVESLQYILNNTGNHFPFCISYKLLKKNSLIKTPASGVHLISCEWIKKPIFNESLWKQDSIWISNLIVLLTYQFDVWQSIMYISCVVKLLFSLGWQSFRGNVSVKLLVPITILGWYQKRNFF